MAILYSYAADRTSDKREAFLSDDEADEQATCPECGDLADRITSPHHGGLWNGCRCGWRETGWYPEAQSANPAA